MNTVKSILLELKAKDKYSYYDRIEVLINEPNLLKLRLYIRDDFFVQVYRNDDSKTTSFALVLGKDRIFGRDEENKIWHRHHIDNPTHCDLSEKGKKSSNLKRFLKEVNKILVELELIN